MSFASPIDLEDTEGVIFVLCTYTRRVSYLWSDRSLTKSTIREPCYLRKHGMFFLNYTNNLVEPGIRVCERIYPGFMREQSYYVYVDGIPLIFPKCRHAVLSCDGNYARSSAGTNYTFTELVGTYLWDLDRYKPIRRDYGATWSAQQINVMKLNVWTVGQFLDQYPFLEKLPVDFFINRFKIVDKYDTLCIDTIQIQVKNSIGVDLNQLSLDLKIGNNYFDLITKMYRENMYISNVKIPSYRGINDNIVLSYKGDWYVKRRTLGHKRIKLKNNKLELKPGVWFSIGYQK
jgi:hypothetical protein